MRQGIMSCSENAYISTLTMFFPCIIYSYAVIRHKFNIAISFVWSCAIGIVYSKCYSTPFFISPVLNAQALSNAFLYLGLNNSTIVETGMHLVLLEWKRVSITYAVNITKFQWIYTNFFCQHIYYNFLCCMNLRSSKCSESRIPFLVCIYAICFTCNIGNGVRCTHVLSKFCYQPR